MVGSGGAGRSAFPVWSWLEGRLVLPHACGVAAALMPFFTLKAFRTARGTSPLKSSRTDLLPDFHQLASHSDTRASAIPRLLCALEQSHGFRGLSS